MAIAITISNSKMQFNTKFVPIFDKISFVARALITNGKVNAAKLG